MSVIIVGAGVAGLVVADRLLDAGKDVIVLEKQAIVGGLCRSYQYGDFVFDVGPHRLYSRDKEIMQYFTSVLGSQYSTVGRDTEVSMLGRRLRWPLSARSVFHLPFGISLRCLFDILKTRKIPENQIANLKDYVIANYGQTIFETFWEGYTEKFMGIPCENVDVKWGKMSVERSSIDSKQAPHALIDLLWRCFSFKSENLQFLYPAKGMGLFCELIADRIRKKGGKILLSQDISEMNVSQNGISHVHVGDEVHAADEVVWTGSLIDLCRLMDENNPDIEYLSTMLYNVEINSELDGKWQWVYFSETDCIFSRITRPCKFDSNLAPSNKTGLCVEVTCRENDDLWQNPESITDRVMKQLVDVGLGIDKQHISECHIEHVANTYPIYRKGYQKKTNMAFDSLEQYSNLHLVGRQSAFVHDNIDESVYNAMRQADKILNCECL